MPPLPGAAFSFVTWSDIKKSCLLPQGAIKFTAGIGEHAPAFLRLTGHPASP